MHKYSSLTCHTRVSIKVVAVADGAGAVSSQECAVFVVAVTGYRAAVSESGNCRNTLMH